MESPAPPRFEAAVRIGCMLLCVLVGAACGSSSSPDPLRDAKRDLAAGRWSSAQAKCSAAADAIDAGSADRCTARYCEFVAETMLFVDELSTTARSWT